MWPLKSDAHGDEKQESFGGLEYGTIYFKWGILCASNNVHYLSTVLLLLSLKWSKYLVKTKFI